MPYGSVREVRGTRGNLQEHAGLPAGCEDGKECLVPDEGHGCREKNGGKVVWRCIRDIQRGRKGLVPVRMAVVKDEDGNTCNIQHGRRGLVPVRMAAVKDEEGNTCNIQHGRKGLVPVRMAAVKDEDGNTCNTPEMQQQRWRRHFTKILNLQSEFSVEELDKVRQRPLKPAMAEIPSEEELQSALGKLKSGKAGGESGILPEMLKAVCWEEEFMKLLLELVKDVWRGKFL